MAAFEKSNTHAASVSTELLKPSPAAPRRQTELRRLLLLDANDRDAEWIEGQLGLAFERPQVRRARSWQSVNEGFEPERFDCVVLDPGDMTQGGLASIPEIRRAGDQIAIVVVTDHGNESQAAQAIQLGAQACLAKTGLTASTLRCAVDAAIERVALENRLASERRELEQFVAVLAHDLQQPLCAVKGNVELIRDYYGDRLPPQAAETLNVAIRMSARMSEMIAGLAAYARSRRPLVEPAKTDLNEVLEATRANLRIALEKSGAVVEHPNLPAVWGDEIGLIQLFQNLLSNAIKFQQGRTPRIEISAERAGDYWTIGVKDNGVGIALRDQESIFEPFERSNAARAYQGCGIGLATCRQIVERHGGRIWVRSALGEGSTFFSQLPAEAKALGEALQPGLQVLLVAGPDSPLAAAGPYLRRRGLQALNANCEADVLAALRRRRRDVAVVEISAHDADPDLRAVARIRRLQPSCKVIAVSAGSEKTSPGELLQAAKKCGADTVYPSPCGRREILRMVQEAVVCPSRRLPVNQG